MPLLSTVPTRLQNAVYAVAPALQQYNNALNVTAPERWSMDDLGTTRIIISGVKQSGVVGAWDVTYSRTNLSLLFAPLRFDVDLRKLSTPEAFLTHLEQRYGISATVEDFEFPTTPPDASAYATYSLQAASSSYNFVGSILLHHWVDLTEELGTGPLTADVDSGIDLASTYSYPLDFTELSAIEQLTADSFDPVELAIALQEETGDVWVCDQSHSTYNTYGSSFIEHTPGCVRIQLVPEYSTIHGILSLRYEVPAL